MDDELRVLGGVLERFLREGPKAPYISTEFGELLIDGRIDITDAERDLIERVRRRA